MGGMNTVQIFQIRIQWVEKETHDSFSLSSRRLRPELDEGDLFCNYLILAVSFFNLTTLEASSLKL